MWFCSAALLLGLGETGSPESSVGVGGHCCSLSVSPRTQATDKQTFGVTRERNDSKQWWSRDSPSVGQRSSPSPWETTLGWDMVVSRPLERFWSPSSRLHCKKAQLLSPSQPSLEAPCERLGGEAIQRATRGPFQSHARPHPGRAGAALQVPHTGWTFAKCGCVIDGGAPHSVFPPSCSLSFCFPAPFPLGPLRVSLPGSAAP